MANLGTGKSGGKKRPRDEKDNKDSASKRARDGSQSADASMEDVTATNSASSSATAANSSSSSSPSSFVLQQQQQLQQSQQLLPPESLIPVVIPLGPQSYPGSLVYPPQMPQYSQQQFFMPGAMPFGYQPAMSAQQFPAASVQSPLQYQLQSQIPISSFRGQPLPNQLAPTAIPTNLGQLHLNSSLAISPANLNNVKDLITILTQRWTLAIKFLNEIDTLNREQQLFQYAAQLQYPVITDTTLLRSGYNGLTQYTIALKNLFYGNEQKSDLSNSILKELQGIAEFWKKEIQKLCNYICLIPQLNTEKLQQAIQIHYPTQFDPSLSTLSFARASYQQELFAYNEGLYKLVFPNAKVASNSMAIASSNSAGTSSSSNDASRNSSAAVDSSSGSLSSSNSSASAASSLTTPPVSQLSQPGNNPSLARTDFFQQPPTPVHTQQLPKESKQNSPKATSVASENKTVNLDEKLKFDRKFKEQIDEWFVMDPITASRMLVTFIDHFCKPILDTRLELDEIPLDLANFVNFCQTDAGKKMWVFSEITTLKMGSNQSPTPKLCTFIDNVFSTTHLSSSSSSSSSSSQSSKPQLDDNAILAAKYSLNTELTAIAKNWYSADFLRACRVLAGFYDYAVEAVYELQSRVSSAKTNVTYGVLTLTDVDFQNFFKHPAGKRLEDMANAAQTKMKQDPDQSKYLQLPKPKS